MFNILSMRKVTASGLGRCAHIKKAIKICNFYDDNFLTHCYKLERSVLQFFIFFKNNGIKQIKNYLYTINLFNIRTIKLHIICSIIDPH